MVRFGSDSNLLLALVSVPWDHFTATTVSATFQTPRHRERVHVCACRRACVYMWGPQHAREPPLSCVCTGSSFSQASQTQLLYVNLRRDASFDHVRILLRSFSMRSCRFVPKETENLPFGDDLDHRSKTKDVWLLETKDPPTSQMAVCKPLTFNFPADRTALSASRLSLHGGSS